jgi:hypothetical protein
MTFSTLQLTLYRLADEICPIFPLDQNAFNPGERPGWEPGLHILRPQLFPSHGDYFSYEVLTMDKS